MNKEQLLNDLFWVLYLTENKEVYSIIERTMDFIKEGENE